MSSSNHEKYLLNNTLACVANLCVGRVTTVELRNEAHVTGRVVEVDGHMNVTMSDVRFHDPARRAKDFPSFFVHHRNIRGVQIPAEIDMRQELDRMFDPTKVKAKGGRGRSEFGVSAQRKKIMSKRAARQAEDAANAARIMEEQQKGKKDEK